MFDNDLHAGHFRCNVRGSSRERLGAMLHPDEDVSGGAPGRRNRRDAAMCIEPPGYKDEGQGSREGSPISPLFSGYVYAAFSWWGGKPSWDTSNG